MRELLTRLVCLATTAQLLFGCSVFQQAGNTSVTASIQSQRSASTELALHEIEEIDILIKLNNRSLSDYIEAEIQTQTASTDRYKFKNIKLSFQRQYIHLESLVDILDDDKNIISVAVSGEVLLHFSGDSLEWYPRFSQLKISSRDFKFQGTSYPEATPQVTESVLHRLNSDISGILISRNSNEVPLNMMPLGEIQVGVSLPGLSPSPALLNRPLTGSARIFDSVILIDSKVTTIAMDLVFNQGQTLCPSVPGCTMRSDPTYNPEPETIITHVTQDEARQGFAVLKDEFEIRTAGFFISEEKPAIALIEIRRPFLREALQVSLADIDMDAEFEAADLSFPIFSALLQPFDANSIMCERSDCTSPPTCKADLAQCKRLRDTRDCSSCVFRNPLNNRCASEETDPVCVSERSLQNTRYDAERAACITKAEGLKRECDDTSAQSLLSCQLESDNDYSSCESARRSIKNLASGASLASISAQTKASGRLVANFSNFRIEGDLKRLKLDMGLKSDLQLKGKLRFNPGDHTRPLANCIADWNAPFSSRFITTPTVNNLISNFEFSSGELTANWSGFGMAVHAEPSPIASILVNKPRLLTRCNIGLTMDTVKRALEGDDAEFFLGQLNLEIQPLPTTIHFTPATITLGNHVYSGTARLSNRNLRYEITD